MFNIILPVIKPGYSGQELRVVPLSWSPRLRLKTKLFPAFLKLHIAVGSASNYPVKLVVGGGESFFLNVTFSLTCA